MATPLTDALLATFHHLAAFTLVSILLAEWCMTALPDPTERDLARLRRLDLLYGVMAAVALLCGVARLVWGSQAWSHYAASPAFWAKMACFAAIGALSVKPTLLLLGTREAAADGHAGTLRRIRRWISAELCALPALLLFASLMARGF
jgi:putative membrane protein